ncbi:MAG: hypothetical protein NZ902_04800 [Acidilobaceae archaeon]|nr:hypothetical protein [Acidilobaceae archaeon]MCX8165888.1 hypothetical protein [Acidilobaceae archaeon]MDW7974530.1 hypothetical protein [Sulfolobales archaeon]
MSKEKAPKRAKKQEKVELKPEYVQAQLETNLSQEILVKAKAELPKEKYVTPFKVAQKYGIKISTAKRLLKILAGEEVLVRAGGNRRAPIFSPR